MNNHQDAIDVMNQLAASQVKELSQAESIKAYQDNEQHLHGVIEVKDVMIYNWQKEVEQLRKDISASQLRVRELEKSLVLIAMVFSV